MPEREGGTHTAYHAQMDYSDLAGKMNGDALLSFNLTIRKSPPVGDRRDPQDNHSAPSLYK